MIYLCKKIQSILYTLNSILYIGTRYQILSGGNSLLKKRIPPTLRIRSGTVSNHCNARFTAQMPLASDLMN